MNDDDTVAYKAAVCQLLIFQTDLPSYGSPPDMCSPAAYPPRYELPANLLASLPSITRGDIPPETSTTLPESFSVKKAGNHLIPFDLVPTQLPCRPHRTTTAPPPF